MRTPHLPTRYQATADGDSEQLVVLVARLERLLGHASSLLLRLEILEDKLDRRLRPYGDGRRTSERWR